MPDPVEQKLEKGKDIDYMDILRKNIQVGEMESTNVLRFKCTQFI